ncbi:unnamed protein product [Symbiodinium natans]|uniref:Uncharacterized protein n=1 Tax=Symbiodinium natans TaxID=878477 RepID=A0A812JWR5_9DINO|nr:unnamed protein product [Symbiodinium natans]
MSESYQEEFVEMVIRGLAGPPLMTRSFPESTKIRAVKKALKDAKPDWKWSHIQLAAGDQICNNFHSLYRLAKDGKLEVTATAMQSLEAIEVWCHEVMEHAFNEPLEMGEYADVPLERLPLDELANTHLNMLLRENFGNHLPQPLYCPNDTIKSVAEEIHRSICAERDRDGSTQAAP